MWYTSYVPYTCGILKTLFSYLIDGVWLPGLCCPAHKGERTNHGCRLGSSHHFGVSHVQTGAIGRWPRVIMNCEDAANSQPLKSACVCISTIKRAAKETFHSLWVVFGLGLDLHTNKKIEKATAWGWERSTGLLLLYLLYRMTPETFLSHSHHELFVWLAQAAVSVACFC